MLLVHEGRMPCPQHAQSCRLESTHHCRSAANATRMSTRGMCGRTWVSDTGRYQGQSKRSSCNTESTPSARHVRPLRVIDNVKHPYMVTDIRLEVATQVPVRMVRHADDGGLPSVWHVIQCSTRHLDTSGNADIAHRHLPCR